MPNVAGRILRRAVGSKKVDDRHKIVSLGKRSYQKVRMYRLWFPSGLPAPIKTA